MIIAGPLPPCSCGAPSVYLAIGWQRWVCEKHKDEYFKELDEEVYPPPLTAPPPQWLTVNPVTGLIDWLTGLSFQGRFFSGKNVSLNEWLISHGMRPIPVTPVGARIGDAEYAYLAANLQVRHEHEIVELLGRFQPTEKLEDGLYPEEQQAYLEALQSQPRWRCQNCGNVGRNGQDAKGYCKACGAEN